MSALLYNHIKELEAIVAKLRIEVAEYRRAEEEPFEPTRRVYPPDAERGENGRVITRCRKCGRVTEIRARGLCSSCYSRWRRRSLVSLAYVQRV